jgi:cell division protein FtsB
MPASARVVRLAGRLALLVLTLAVVAVAAVQFAGIVAKNVALAGELSATRAQIAALRAREASQRRAIARLGDAAGAVPEIHDELHMVGPNEEIIYVRGLAQPSPQARREDSWP